MQPWVITSHTEQGPVRPEQQDRVRVFEETATPWGPATVLAVFDGMGGIPNGGQASLAAASSLVPALEQAAGGLDLLRRLNEAVFATGGGTTAVVAVLDGEVARISAVGDSAAYRIRAGEAELLAPKDATDPTTLTDYLGHADMRGHAIEARTAPGDVLLLCTDGVDQVLRMPDIARRLYAGRHDPSAALTMVFQELRAARMPDNASAVVAVRQ